MWKMHTDHEGMKIKPSKLSLENEMDGTEGCGK
jgi:hypothetical protein